MRIKTYLITGWMCFLALGLLAGEKPDEELLRFKELYPNQPAIYLKDESVLTYSFSGDSVIATIKNYKEILHLGENTAAVADDKIYYSPSSTLVRDVKAYTLQPGKKKYARLEVTEFEESYDEDSDVFFDDVKTITFRYPGVQPGAKTVLEYTRDFKFPMLINPFYLDTHMPVHETALTVKYQDGIVPNVQYYNKAEEMVDRSEGKDDLGFNFIKFKAESVSPIEFDRNCPSFTTMASSVYCPIKYYEINGKETEVISTIDNLHAWYRTLVQGILGSDEQLKNLVDEIVSPDDTDMEKVKKIFYWVQANVRYVAFEDGMRGFIPHPAEYVMDKRYGDCKDMSSLLVGMLREAGVKANYTWIGSRDLPYKYSQTPSPITDNHMIATYEQEDKIYYLDATGQYIPLGYPTSMIQGKESLVSYGEEDFEIHTVPVIPKERNVMSDTMTVTIADGLLTGQGRLRLTGFAKVFNAYRLVKANQADVKKYLERLIGKGSNKFELTSFEVSNLEDLENPTIVDYTFSIPDYYKSIGEKIYINLVLDKTMTDVLYKDRKSPHEIDYKYINNSVVKFQIPEGYSISGLPNDESGQKEFFGYGIRYEPGETEVVVSRQFYLDYLILETSQFSDWNAIIKEFAGASRNALVLEKKK